MLGDVHDPCHEVMCDLKKRSECDCQVIGNTQHLCRSQQPMVDPYAYAHWGLQVPVLLSLVCNGVIGGMITCIYCRRWWGRGGCC